MRRYGCVTNPSPRGVGELAYRRALLMVGIEAPEGEYREALDAVCAVARSVLLYAASRGVEGGVLEGVLEELDEYVQGEAARRKRMDSERSTFG